MLSNLFSRYSFLFMLGFSPFYLLSCHQQAKSEKKVKATVDKISNRIVLQPFSDFTKADAHKISEKLKKLGLKTEVAEPINHPSSAWRDGRARYRADSLIRYLCGFTSEGDITIGLTNYDVSTTKDGKEDWGVMGLGFRPGKACVISTFRIKGKNREEKFAKVIVHEFGHTRGLDHCPVKDCLMRDAEGKDHLDEETSFCKTCAGYLAKAGYRIY